MITLKAVEDKSGIRKVQFRAEQTMGLFYFSSVTFTKWSPQARTYSRTQGTRNLISVAGE
jgi:hypothetical protein